MKNYKDQEIKQLHLQKQDCVYCQLLYTQFGGGSESLRVFQICLDMGGGKMTLFILFLISPFPRRRTKLPLVTWFQTCNKCKTPKCVHSTTKFISASALHMGGYCCLCCVWRTFVIK